MISRTWPLTICLLALVVACGGQTDATTSPGPAAADSSAPSISNTTDALAPTTTRRTTTTPPADTTTTSTPTSTTILPIPTLDDGRPATFVAVTDDYEAVEVDTATGSVVRRFGHRADAASLAASDEIAPNVVDGVWRSASGEVVLISECCEPAAGRITFLSDDETLDPDYREPAWHGWWVVPSPSSDHVIITGYFTQVVDATEGPEAATDAVTLFENDGSGVGAIGWGRDASSIHWYDDSTGDLVTRVGSGGEFSISSSVAIDWIGPDQHLSGLDAQASGNLVSFLTQVGSNGEMIDTRGVVYSSRTGELLAEFDVPAGSSFGGYDPSGRFLIYTTPSGVVTYQASGRTGVLGERYLFASW